ncbi:hypothetical protein BLJ79_12270 [Arthrobacter sp. UCD-GKA]|nr:hypothetical protein BLJ79_12270 [Arthrobacter sp. UCD-GKA]
MIHMLDGGTTIGTCIVVPVVHVHGSVADVTVGVVAGTADNFQAGWCAHIPSEVLKGKKLVALSAAVDTVRA